MLIHYNTYTNLLHNILLKASFRSDVIIMLNKYN